MSGEKSSGHMGRSIGAVAGGIAVGLILTLATDVVLHITGVFPPLGQPAGSPPLVLATVYRADRPSGRTGIPLDSLSRPCRARGWGASCASIN